MNLQIKSFAKELWEILKKKGTKKLKLKNNNL